MIEYSTNKNLAIYSSFEGYLKPQKYLYEEISACAFCNCFSSFSSLDLSL